MKRILSVVLAVGLILSMMLSVGLISANSAQADVTFSADTQAIIHEELHEGVNTVVCTGGRYHSFPFYPEGAGEWIFSFTNKKTGSIVSAVVVYQGIDSGGIYDLDSPIKCASGGNFEIQVTLGRYTSEAQFDIVVSNTQTTVPKITSLTSDKNGIKIEWEPVAGAASYRVYYESAAGGWRSFSEDVTGTSMTDSAVSYGRKETYTIRALDQNGDYLYGYNHTGWSTVYGVETPQITNMYCDEAGIHLEWTPIKGVSYYRVYYKAYGSWKRIEGDVNATKMLDYGVLYNKTECYTIRAVNKKGEVISDYNPDGWKITYKVDTPQITSLTSDEDGIHIKWNPVEGVSTYRVYYKTGSGDWRRFVSDVTGTEKLDTGVLYNRAETYTVRALDLSGEPISDYKSAGWTTTYHVDTPQITSLTSDENGIHIKWNPVKGATTYRVYYKTGSGDWKRFASDVTGTTKLDTGVKYNRAETYTVRALNKNGDVMSGYRSQGWTTVYRVDTPKITKLENTSDGIRITWNAVPGASTYRVYYKTGSGEWRRFNTDIKGTSRMDTGVKVGRAETYTVRALDTKGNPISDYYDPGWSIVYNNP